MFISLFTSRIILEALGFENYGIYALVGGMVALMSFMQSSLSGATTRFLNYEMGQKNALKLRFVFSNAFFIHCVLSIVLLILAETVGLWYVYNKLNINPSRFNAALITYQISVITTIISILQTPYNALIIANQRMNIFAFVSIYESITKLFISYLILIASTDKLITYSILLFVNNLIIQFFYIIYCNKHFIESKLLFKIDRYFIREIGLFFGLDLYGNFTAVARDQGIQILQNNYFGVVINSSVSLTTTISGIVSGLSNNFTIASKPQIFQYYSQGKIQEMLNLTFFSIRISFYLMSILSICLILQTEFYLTLWLKNLPTYLVDFTKLSLCIVLLKSIFGILNQPIHATGNIKALSFMNGTIFLINLPIIYILFKYGFTPIYSYIVLLFSAVIEAVLKLMIVKRLINEFSLINFIKAIFFKNVVTILIGIIPGLLFVQMITLNFYTEIIYSFLLIIGVLLSIYFIGLNKYEQEKIKLTLLKKIK